MKLVGERVLHKIYGVGTVVDQSDTMITVSFPDKEARFKYPDAETFSKFLKAENAELQDAVTEEYRQIAEEAKRQREEEASRAEESRLALEQSKTGQDQVTKEIKKQKREPGKRMVFFVFQANVFDEQCENGYIWAPVANRAGNTVFHWETMLDVREGDIILHGSNSYIKAISTARGECYESPYPDEEGRDINYPTGRKIDCDYIRIANPVRTAQVRDDVIRLSRAKYSPFDRNGDGNMGYLYELNRDLARIFLREIIAKNPEIGEIDYIQELMNEKSAD